MTEIERRRIERNYRWYRALARRKDLFAGVTQKHKQVWWRYVFNQLSKYQKLRETISR